MRAPAGPAPGTGGLQPDLLDSSTRPILNPTMRRRLSAWALPALFTLVLALAACRQAPDADADRAPGDPVAAIEAQAAALRANDLARYARLSLPEDLYDRSVALWNDQAARAEPVAADDAAEYEEMMARLMADDAEAAMMRDLEPKLVQFEQEMASQWPLMQATAGIFLNAAIQANPDLSDADKAHGTELVGALLAWAQPALITDRERARRAISSAAATARDLQLPTLEAARALDHTQAMAKGGRLLAGAKDIARAYDLDLDQALDGIETELLSSEGDRATVRVSYPLLGKTISFEQDMQRVDGAWYSADAIAAAEQAIADAAQDGAASTAAPAAPADAAVDASQPVPAG